MATSLDMSVTGSEILVLLDKIGISQGDVARETGLHRTTISRICKDQYQAADGAAKAALLGHLERRLNDAQAQEGQAKVRSLRSVDTATAPKLPDSPPSLSTPWGGPYCTQGQRLMWAVLQATREDRELTLLTALSGCGKSYLIDRYQEQHPHTLIYRPLRGISQSGLLEDLCRLFGVAYSGSNDTRRRRLLEAAQGRFLIVDEADLLVAGRYAHQAVERLELYRQLQERGAAVALVGLPALVQTVVTGGETYVFSRIGYARQGPAPTQEELAAYWRAQMAGYPQAAAQAGAVALSAARHGHLRYLDKLARRTRALDGDVQAASTLLFRGESA